MLIPPYVRFNRYHVSFRLQLPSGRACKTLLSSSSAHSGLCAGRTTTHTHTQPPPSPTTLSRPPSQPLLSAPKRLPPLLASLIEVPFCLTQAYGPLSGLCHPKRCRLSRTAVFFDTDNPHDHHYHHYHIQQSTVHPNPTLRSPARPNRLNTLKKPRFEIVLSNKGYTIYLAISAACTAMRSSVPVPDSPALREGLQHHCTTTVPKPNRSQHTHHLP